jgi:8-oxo-dGTP diphosphatase
MGFLFFEPRQHAAWLRRIAPLRWALKLAVRVLVPTHYVGAVAAVFDDRGRVLLVEHVFRTDHPWGLPGGWISRGEAPSAAVVRELREELDIEIEIRELVAAARIPATRMANHPSHLGLAYYARLKTAGSIRSREVLSLRWAAPDSLDEDLAPFQRSAIIAAQAAFSRDRPAAKA